MKYRSFNYLLASILTLTAFGKAFITNPTAYEWPTIDMAPLWEKLANPAVLANDFFTQASLSSNPRHIYGYLVYGLAKFFHTDWYTILFVFKSVILLVLPTLFFFSLVKSQEQRITDSKNKFIFSTVIFGFTVSVILLSLVPKMFSIAWWSPYNPIVNPHTISLFLGLLGIISFHCYSDKKNILKHAYLIFWILGTLIHPVIGMLVFAFHYSLAPQYLSFKRTSIEFIVSLVAPIAIIQVIFSSNAHLTTQEFVQIYCYENHSHHYIPSLFGTATPFPWWVSLLLTCAMMVAALAYGTFKKLRSIQVLASTFLILYAGSVLIQYLFVELKPIKVVATIGIVRFTIFGYWMLAVLYAWIATDLLPQLYHIIQRLFYFQSLPFKLSWVFYGLGLTQVILLITFKKDNPQQATAQNKTLYEWIQKNTPPNSVFIANKNTTLNTHIPIITKRAVFTGNGFPFDQKFFKEYSNRHQFMFGKVEDLQKFSGKTMVERQSKFYRTLSPKDFKESSLQYKLDYVIIEKSHAQTFIEQKIPIAYEDIKSNFLVFDIKELKVSRK